MVISIITATYNSSATVEDTLLSVKNQQGVSVEHIIVDGGSKDNSLDIIKQFPHVTKIISEPDNGIYDAMNKGLALATGDIVGILNSDDVYTHEHVLEKIAGIFEDEKVDVCYADLQYVQQNNLDKIVRNWKAGQFSARSFYWGWMPPHPTVFVRRHVYDKVGDFNTILKSAADYELLLRIFVKSDFNIGYLPEYIVKMRAGGISNASLKNRLRANGEDKKAWKLNELTPYFFTCYIKPLRKVFQFLIK